MITPDWQENRLTMAELARKLKLVAGTALRFPGGEIELVGTLNQMGGDCDDCLRHRAGEVPTHIARLVRLDDIDTRIKPKGTS